MKYPKHDIYETMYKRYFKRGPEALFPLDMNLDGKEVLDLCGGGGRATNHALSRGANVTYVDQERDMIPRYFNHNPKVRVFDCSVEKFVWAAKTNLCVNRFDLVVCQQGINYWWRPGLIPKLVEMIKPEGRFVFNTFNTMPAEIPITKEYQHEGKFYSETSYRIKDTVHHVQSCEGYPPHMTEFKWIAPEEFNSSLLMNFSIVTEKSTKTTSIWECTK